MKALSLTQPYATLVAIGAKKIETRSWSTRWRGAIAIHAAKRFPPEYRFLCEKEEFFKALSPGAYIRHAFDPTFDWDYTFDFEKFSLGCIIATARIETCMQIPPQPQALSDDGGIYMLPPAEPELSFGCYTAGRYAWILKDVEMLPEPFPVKGSLGLWDWEPAAV